MKILPIASLDHGRCLALNDLLREAMGESPINRKTTELWDWKHRRNPFGLSEGCYAWDAEREIVLGTRPLMQWRFVGPSGDPIPALRAVDTATRAEFRRQGTFSSLTSCAIASSRERGAAFVFNTPNSKSLPGYLKLGWKEVARWPVYFKVLRPETFSSRHEKSPSEGLPRWRSVFGAEFLTWKEFRDVYGDSLRASLADWETRRAGVGYRTIRSLEYLDWRFGAHPFVTYGVYPLVDRGGLAAFAIVRPNLRSGLKEAVLVEVFARAPDPELLTGLLKTSIASLGADYAIAHFGEGSPEKRALLDSGFATRHGQSIPFAVRCLRGTEPAAQSAGQWDLSFGDLELL